MNEDDAVALFDRLVAEYDGWYQTPLGALADALEQAAVFALAGEVAGRMAENILDVGCRRTRSCVLSSSRWGDD
jgi:hypothetical protein